MVMKSRGGGQPEAGEGSTLESRASSGENDGDMLTIRRARDAPMALSLASRRSSYAPPRVQDTPTRREGDRSVKHGHRNREVCILPSRHSRDKSCRRGRDVSRTATNKTRRSDGTRACDEASCAPPQCVRLSVRDLLQGGACSAPAPRSLCTRGASARRFTVLFTDQMQQAYCMI